jgi:hypothetical protein
MNHPPDVGETHHLRRPTEAPRLYTQDGKGYDATVHAHYFVAGCDWLVTEYDPSDDLTFGWCCLNGDRQNAELGYTSLTEMEEVEIPLTLQLGDGREVGFGVTGVEWDDHWPTGLTLTEAIALLDERQGRS